MRIGLIGSVASSKMALETLLCVQGVSVCAVVTKEKSNMNSDFFNLNDICQVENIPCHYEKLGHAQATNLFLKKYELDLIFCIGWSFLLDEELLKIPKKMVIGFHPAKLPENRGRHPIVWALALGLEQTASTFFQIDKGTDTGPILSQELIPITQEDDAATLYEKILRTAKLQLENLCDQFLNNKVKAILQNDAMATYWRRRGEKDGLIDFRMRAEDIHNLIRGLAPPYPCAHVERAKSKLLVHKSKISPTKFAINIEPGKVLQRKNSKLLVKCSGDSAIWIETVDLYGIEVGDYL